MDALLEIQKIINALFDEKAEGFRTKEGKHLYPFRPGDAIRFYDKGNKDAGIRLRRAMKYIKLKSQEVRMEVSRLKNAQKENEE